MLSKQYGWLWGSLFILAGLGWGFLNNEVYLFPLDEYRALSGTFGELRTNHFHSGIDVKVGGKVGIPIRAIQDGYVYRIKVSPFGFGNAIYLRHPDGRFSVYAHMSRFNARIEDYTYLRQYGSKKYAQELYLRKDEIPVRKGEVIGYSGNSGSSTGPHLHFEIRDPEENILNPLLYYKNIITDHKPPIVQEIGIQPMDLNARVRGEFRKLTLTPNGGDGRFTLGETVQVQGKIGLEYRAYDLLDGAGNHCGINYARLYLDDELIYAYSLDRFSFDEKRYINLHIDYPYYQARRQRMERAYVERGNQFNAYKHHDRQGIIELKDNEVHTFRLVLTDAHNNQSYITGRLQRVANASPLPVLPVSSASPQAHYQIENDILVISIKNPRPEHLQGIRYRNVHGETKDLLPAYYQNQALVFLLPLARHDYPAEVLDTETQPLLTFHLREEINAGQNNLVELDEMQLFFPYQAVFDRVHLEILKKPGTGQTYTDVYQVGEPSVPLFKSFLVSFKPSPEIPLNHLVVAYRDQDKWSFAGKTMGEQGNVYASVMEFGEYALMADSIAPTIEPINFQNGGTFTSKNSSIVLRVKDDFAGVNDESIYCTLDGKWLLFEYDYKRNTITHRLDKQGRPAKGQYQLKVAASDKARNEREVSFTISF